MISQNNEMGKLLSGRKITKDVLVLTQSHQSNKPVLVINFCGDTIERNNLIKYLGVRFNCGLRFTYHVDHLTAKTRKRLAVQTMVIALISGFGPLGD